MQPRSEIVLLGVHTILKTIWQSESKSSTRGSNPSFFETWVYYALDMIEKVTVHLCIVGSSWNTTWKVCIWSIDCDIDIGFEWQKSYLHSCVACGIGLTVTLTLHWVTESSAFKCCMRIGSDAMTVTTTRVILVSFPNPLALESEVRWETCDTNTQLLDPFTFWDKQKGRQIHKHN